MITINSEEVVCLVDLSYYVFYRYHALKRWLILSEKTLEGEDFLKKFGDLFIGHLKNISRKLKVKYNNIILVGDCRRKDIWRNNIYDGYKDRKSNMDIDVFTYMYDHILPNFPKPLNKIQFICGDNLEADDVVYIITKQIPNRIIILTNDNDYLQMINDNITCVNLPAFNNIGERCKHSGRVGLLSKVCLGDPSDNIKGLISKKEFNTLLDKSDSEIETYMEKHGLNEKYKLNRKLICLEHIPEALCENIRNKISIV